jgi:hypothetical protein
MKAEPKTKIRKQLVLLVSSSGIGKEKMMRDW